MDSRAGAHYLNRTRYRPLDFVVVRAPLLPFEQYIDLNCAGSLDVAAVAARLSAQPQIERALALGNPAFYDAVQTMLAEHISASVKDNAVHKNGKTHDKVIGKLLRLLIRMSTRPTPLGLYAGVGIGRWSSTSTTTMAFSGQPPVTHSRLDSEFLAKLALGLEQHCLNSLALFQNPAAHMMANRIYLVEKAATLNEKDVDGLSIEATAEVLAVLDAAIQPITYSQLVRKLSDFSFSEQDAFEMISQLVQTTLLMTNLRAAALDTSGRSLLSLLGGVPECEQISSLVAKILQDISSMDRTINEMSIPEVNGVVRQSANIVSTSTGICCQTDMALPLEGNELNKAVGEDVARFTDLLIKLGFVETVAPGIADYRNLFMARYEGREVPLMELLNQDFGLGLPSLAAESPSQRQPSDGEATRKKRNRLLSSLINRAIRDQQSEIVLDDHWIRNFCNQENSEEVLVLSFDAFVTLLAPSPAHLDNGDYRLANFNSAPGAGRNIGRFADLLGEPAAEALQHCGVTEQHAHNRCEAVFAQLCSLPRTLRVANVGPVSTIHAHRICTDSTPGGTDTVDMNDLWVGVENNRFYLRSVKLGRRVIVTVNHLMDQKFNTATARFLRDASMDGLKMAVPFRWGELSQSCFLPRVRYGKFILASAQWNIFASDEPAEAFTNRGDFETWLAQWRQRWLVPRHVYLTQYDNRLLLDLENADQRNELRKELEASLRTDEVIHLQEAFCSDEDLWLKGPEGKYVSELVVPMVLDYTPTAEATEKKLPARQSSAPKLTFNPNTVARATRFCPPGGDWLYAKFYCGTNLMDELIAGPLADLARRSQTSKLARLWFFIRFADPEPHVRLRFRTSNNTAAVRLYEEVTRLGADLIASGVCNRMTIDTYDREIERYGGPDAIAVAERLFACDSELAATVITQELNESWHADRKVTCAATIDRMLSALGLDMEKRLEWYQQYSTARNESSKTYRAQKTALSKLFGAGSEERRVLDPMLFDWSTALEGIGTTYAELAERGVLSRDLWFIYRSFIHMHCNRMLGLDNEQEDLTIALASRALEATNRSSKERSPRCSNHDSG